MTFTLTPEIQLRADSYAVLPLIPQKQQPAFLSS